MLPESQKEQSKSLLAFKDLSNFKPSNSLPELNYLFSRLHLVL